MHSNTTHTTTGTGTAAVPPTTGASAGAGLGAKIKGAAQAVHGVGERLRGNALDAADAATGDRTADAGHMHATGVAKGAQNASVDARGRAETDAGIANMHAPVAGAGTTGTAGSTTTTTTY